jgi:hypothetical protein
MSLDRKRPMRLPAAVLMAVALLGPAAGAGADEVPTQTSWQLRARVRVAPGTPPSGPRALPEAISLVHQAACRGGRNLLGDGRPRQTRIQLTLWRQAGPTDATHAGSPSMGCHVRAQGLSAFRLSGRVAGVTEWMDPAQALARVAEAASHAADRVLATGDRASLSLRLGSTEKPVRDMIRGLARRHGVSVATSLRVAGCESRFSRRAYDHPYAGVYQQDVRYWPRRAARFGHRGASPFDAYPNVDVSLKMARAMGWAHWGCA